MYIARVEYLLKSGEFATSPEWATLKGHVLEAIAAVHWPEGSGCFTIRDEPGKKRGQGSGVKPIKTACMSRLKELGWELEARVRVLSNAMPGRVDAAYRVADRLFCVEWETGNISSSHRALNKMALGLMRGVMVGGILIVPTRELYRFLTDRVGNFEELQPYFPIWRQLGIHEGILAVVAVQHDFVSADVPRIPKGTDGRAAV